MRERERWLGIAVLLLAVGACTDGEGSTRADETPSFDSDDDDDQPTEEEGDPATAADAGRKDAGAKDASAKDASAAKDSGASSVGDAGRDSGTPSAGASARDASLPVADAAIPEGEHCAATADWDPASAAFEDEVLRLTNEARAAGHNCDTEGNFGPAKPLVMEARLRCAARLYSKEMAETGNFSHTSSDGTTFDRRIVEAGFKPTGQLGENIASGQRSPAEVVNGWLESDGHCKNIMNPDYRQIGVGYYPAKPAGGRSSPYWTQDFAGVISSPR